MRAYLLSAFCATVAGMMQVAQDRALIAQSGQGLELIVIASVIVGGASILGGRGRVLGSMLGVILVVLIDKVLREGFPTTRIVKVGDIEMKVQAVAQLPPGAVPAFLGLILILAVLIEPWLIRRNAIGRLWARLRGLPMPPAAGQRRRCDRRRADQGQRSRPTARSTRRGLGKFLARRDTAAIMIAIILWCRPLSAAGFLGRRSTTPSISSLPSPRSRCWPSASPSSSAMATSTSRSDRCWR